MRPQNPLWMPSPPFGISNRPGAIERTEEILKFAFVKMYMSIQA